jgi:dTDP-4-amino-4,6-dideoxygalactose transaminase
MKMKNSDNLGKKILSLPISEEHTVKEILYVCKKIKLFFKKYNNN